MVWWCIIHNLHLPKHELWNTKTLKVFTCAPNQVRKHVILLKKAGFTSYNPLGEWDKPEKLAAKMVEVYGDSGMQMGSI